MVDEFFFLLAKCALYVQKLNLRRQQGLSHLALHCPWLRVVDLTECEGLTNLVCEVFCDGGGCPSLHSLTMDNCEVSGLAAFSYRP